MDDTVGTILSFIPAAVVKIGILNAAAVLGVSNRNLLPEYFSIGKTACRVSNLLL